jgi:hypothetical protein
MLFRVVHPADHRMAVGMGLEGRGHEGLEELGLGAVLGAHAPLFHHHVDFLGELLRRQDQVGHAVGFQLERQLQPVFPQGLEIGRVVPGGEGVLPAAGGGDALGKFTGGNILRALEHHVLQHMGDAGAAVALIHAAGPVPDLGHHHRRAPVGLDDDPHAVGQGLFDDFGPDRQGKRRRQSEQCQESLHGGRRKHGGKGSHDRISGLITQPVTDPSRVWFLQVR